MTVSDSPRPSDVVIVGAGAMGSGIAQVAAQAGHTVHLVDTRPGAAAESVERLRATLSRLAARGKISEAEAADAGERLVAGPAAEGDLAHLPPSGLVVEAVVERLEVKRELFAELARHQPAQTVLASNTSSLDISDIARGLPHPERVVGLHFFNPAAVMRLVEVIHGQESDPDIVDAMVEVMRAWGKTPVRCTSTPGFIVNRVARPFYGEAQRMVAEGVADPATIDLALTEGAGFRMGPFALTDLIGQDVNYSVGESVWLQTGKDPRYEPTALQRALVEAGTLGRKTGKGFFAYDQTGTATDAVPDRELAASLTRAAVTANPVARTIAMLINEAVDLVHRGEATAEDVDIAMRLGTNYPQGPFEWLDDLGPEAVAEQLRALDEAYPGGRYRLSPGLATMVSGAPVEGEPGSAPSPVGALLGEGDATGPAGTGGRVDRSDESSVVVRPAPLGMGESA